MLLSRRESRTVLINSKSLNRHMMELDMGEKPDRIYWNGDMETFEAKYADGYILPLRSGFDAEELAKEFGMKVEVAAWS
jgi:hypothetical protein